LLDQSVDEIAVLMYFLGDGRQLHRCARAGTRLLSLADPTCAYVSAVRWTGDLLAAVDVVSSWADPQR